MTAYVIDLWKYHIYKNRKEPPASLQRLNNISHIPKLAPRSDGTNIAKPPLGWHSVSGQVQGALIALLFLLPTLILSHCLNERLSKAILSIEYVERSREAGRITVDQMLAGRLMQNGAFLDQLQQGSAAARRISTCSADTPGFPSADMGAFHRAIDSLTTLLKSRMNELAALSTEARSATTEAALQAVFTRFKHISAEFAPSFPDLKAATEDLCAKMAAESDPIPDAIDLLNEIAASADKQNAALAERVQFKLTILNRGQTDGLVRNEATAKFSAIARTYPMVRVNPPKHSSPFLSNAVPVAVVNEPESAGARGSVGKVEKNAMTEFWFEVDTTQLNQADRNALRSLASQTRIGATVIVVFDQNQNPISTRWTD
jgi:hypothetical protein